MRKQPFDCIRSCTPFLGKARYNVLSQRHDFTL